MFREIAVVVVGMAIGVAGGSLARQATEGWPAEEGSAPVAAEAPAPGSSGTTAPTVPGAGQPPAESGAAPQVPPQALRPGPGAWPLPHLMPPFPPGPMAPGLPPFGGPGLMLPPGGGFGQPPMGAPAPGFPLPPGSGQPPFMAPMPGQPAFPGPGFAQPPLPGPGPGQPPLAGPPPGGNPWPSLASPSHSDVAFGTDPLQRLDLFLPTGSTGSAALMVLFVHGGGWSMGDKAQYTWVGEQLAREGMLVAVVNYRLSPAVQHPAHVQDVAKALAWLARNGATYGGDPSGLYLIGHSAGAHLAALAALDASYLAAEGLSPSIVRGVAGIAGAGYDLDGRYASTPIASLVTAAFGRDPSRWKDAAPLAHVKPVPTSFLLVHGTADTQIPAASTQLFATALQSEGTAAQMSLLPGQDHGSALIAALPSVGGFFRRMDNPQ